MTVPQPRHCWAMRNPDAQAPAADLPPSPSAYLDLRCHRNLRGPYTGGGAMMRVIVPDLQEKNPEMITARATEIIALASDLAPLIPLAPHTLTNLANRAERTRFYPFTRTQRISHGVAELLMDWARLTHPEGIVIGFRELEDADATDRELVCTLLRRCDPRVVTVLVETDGVADGPLNDALTLYAQRVTPAQRIERAPAGADLAQTYIDSDCTSKDPALLRAYAEMTPDERARRHSARAETLTALGEPGSDLGAILYHLEHGTDRAGAGGDAFAAASDVYFDGGFYDAALDISLRGRLLFGDDRPLHYWTLTAKVGACLSYMMRGPEGFAYFAEQRAGTLNADIHMSSCYMMAMLYTRHLPKGQHDEYRALEWVNTAIVIADRNPDPHRRVFMGAFMRNARALVELHRGDLDASLALVNEAIAMTDADLGPDEQLLHRSVLLYNRAQIYAAMGRPDDALVDYDEVIRRDADYGDYYFERAGTRRAAGRHADALEDYATAIRLSPPFHEAHYNRADLLRELGDEEGALADLDYAIELDPTHVDSRVNRADLLLAIGQPKRARIDIEAGLALEPDNANLLTAAGSLSEETGDIEAAITSYTAALAADPTFVAAWVNRAVLAYSAGRLDDAISDLDQAIDVSDDPALRANRAIALQDLGEHARARSDLDIAVEAIGDQNPDLLYRRGASRYALGDVTGAREDWQAHLAAYGDETSPYVAQIQLRVGDLIAQAEVPESVA